MKASAPAAAHLYRALLHLYPTPFRVEFGEEMACDFEDATREAWTIGGWASVLPIWTILARDLLLSVAIQWLRTGVPVVVAVSAAWSISCCVLIAHGVPRNLSMLNAANPTQEMKIMLVGLAVVVLVIAATVLVTGWFWMSVVKTRLARRSGR